MRIRYKSNSKFQIPNSKFKEGQTLIEVIVAMAIVVLLAMSMISTNLVTQRSARSARDNTQAAKLVQQNIEQMRVYRDRFGFSALSDSPPPSYCSYLANSYTNPDPASWSLANCSGPPYLGESIPLNNTTFSRKVEISTVVAGKKSVKVTVSWQESGGTQSVTNTTFLTTWCPGSIVPGSPCPSP